VFDLTHFLLILDAKIGHKNQRRFRFQKIEQKRINLIFGLYFSSDITFKYFLNKYHLILLFLNEIITYN
jgi:hypothetical protein